MRIQAACDAARRLRITTTGGIHESGRVVVDPGGLRIPARGRPALLTVGEVPSAGRLVPWAEVVRLDSERSRAGKGALLFGTFALVPTAIGIGRHGPDLINTNDHLALLFGTAAVVAAATVGALIGASQPDLHRIYP